jgi:transcription initiation factor TFIIIB Brf1 subunit/transcription initiation factor TFIIB
MDAKDLVFSTLEKSGKPMKGGEIAEASGVDKKEVDKVIKKLVAEGKIDSPQRCFYAVKK